MDSIVVMSACFGGYDTVCPPQVGGARFMLFTDGEGCPGWETRRVAPQPTPQRTARYCKVLAPGIEADVIIWHDANLSLKVEPWVLVDEWLEGGADFALFRHPGPDCIYEEAAICKHKGKDRPEIIDRQMARYRAVGLPEHCGLGETTVLARRNTSLAQRFAAAWWSQIRDGSVRDQLSFDYVRWVLSQQTGLKVNFVDGGRDWKRRKHSWFECWRHVK